MKRCFLYAMVLLVLAVPHGWASTFTVEIVPTSETSVTGGQAVSYSVSGVVSDDGNLGLAVFALDVHTTTGVTQVPASPGAGMGPFLQNEGITNSAGYGGAAVGDDLLRIGGGQNTVGNDGMSPNPPYPSGAVVEGVGLGSEVVIAEGSIAAPYAPGTYTVAVTNPFAAVLTGDVGSFYALEIADASVGTDGAFQIEVTRDIPVPTVSGWGLLAIALLTLATGAWYSGGFGRLARRLT